MNFLKTSMLSGLSTIIKLASGLVVNKLIAVYIGPTGIALIGQFQNILSMIITAGSGAISSGIIKYTAEIDDDYKKRNEFLSAGILITAICSVLIGTIVFIFSDQLATYLLNSNEYKSIFQVLGITLIFISFNSFFLSVLNGLKEIKSLILANILGSILSLMITPFLVVNFQLYGSLLSIILVQSIVLVITIFFVKKVRALSIRNLVFKIDKKIFKKLFSYSLMALVTMATVPVTQIAIRNYLIENTSITQTGYWQGVWKISELYLTVLTTAFSTYYLPKLSELHSKVDLKREILSGYKVIIPFVFFSAVVIYLMRDIIIWLLFSPEFVGMKPLFTFQLMGDFFKMCSWTLSFLMVAKAMTRAFIITEIAFAVTLYGIAIIFINLFGVIGATYAYAMTYFLYLILMIIMFRNILFMKRSDVNE